MSSEEHHLALPKLYGAPAYGRPPRAVEVVGYPLDPDDLPLEVERSPEEQELALRLVGSGCASTVNGGASNGRGGHGELQAHPFRLRALTSRIFRED